jgi:serine/threonine protein kinase
MIAGEHRLALPAGYQLGKYRFNEVLGAGGFGITYLAEDHSLGRRVAIKELLPNDIATRLDGSTVVAKTKSEEENLVWARDRFMKEGKALAACDHPNVVNVYEMIEGNGTAYMVTKYEEGRSFSEWLKEVGSAPTEKELRAILMPLLGGLDKVHKAGFLHRDLKPENIYITDDGRPILLDFGSARQAVSDRTTSLTSIVTSGYAPFEQYHEDGKQGAWTDIYALGAVMYRAIHGKKPPEATRRLKDDPCLKLAREYAGKYSTQFLHAIDKSLAVEHQRRPQSIAAWREMLGAGPAEEKIIAEPIWVPWLKKAQPAVEFAREKPALVAGAAAGILVAGLIVWKLAQPDPIPKPEPLPPVAVTPPPEPATPPPQPITPRPAPVPTPVPVTPPPPATPVPSGETTNVWELWKNYRPQPTPFAVPPTPALEPVADVGEKRLVGTWTKESSSRSAPAMRWEIAADGRYSVTTGDTAIDAGTVTASKGILRQTSETSGEAWKGTYQLITASRISTKGVPNAGTWKKVATASAEPDNEGNDDRESTKEKSSGSTTTSKTKRDDTPSRPKSSGTDIERKAKDFGNSMRRRFGF